MSTKLLYGGNWTIPEKKKQKGGWRYTYLIRNTEKSFQSPLEICKIVWHLFLEMPSLGQKPSKIHHGNSTWVFLDHPWKFHFGFLIDPLEFPHAFFRHLLPLAAWNFHFLRVNPPPAFFFPGMAHSKGQKSRPEKFRSSLQYTWKFHVNAHWPLVSVWIFSGMAQAQ